ncbi:MAG: hypothetical protein RLO21_03710 [Nitratireductor sp.]|uniref:hypothetical protein n=1 Tax=Nitratireductor rhodophyticola TaxID=2854036 RepID=UPI0030081AC3
MAERTVFIFNTPDSFQQAIHISVKEYVILLSAWGYSLAGSSFRECLFVSSDRKFETERSQMLECYDLHFPSGQACFGARTRGGVG